MHLSEITAPSIIMGSVLSLKLMPLSEVTAASIMEVSPSGKTAPLLVTLSPLAKDLSPSPTFLWGIEALSMGSRAICA